MSADQGRLLTIVRPSLANIGVLTRDGKRLLIGCAPPEALQRQGIAPETVEWILLTHHHRHVAEGLGRWPALGARLGVPETERGLFEHADERWANDAFRVHAYQYHPSSRTLRSNVPVHHGLTEREPFVWRGITIEAINAPGPSAGGMALIVRDGAKVCAFVGELLTGDGKFRDYWLLQGTRPITGGALMEYHGFGERAMDCVASLERVLARQPDVLVPSLGPIITQPVEAVRRLGARLEAVRRNYHAISSGRWYFADAWPDVPDISADLRRRCRPLPAWVHEVGGTSRCVVAEDGAALLLDCAGDVIERLERLQADGKLAPIEGLWITHYHDDHVEKVNALRKRHACPIIAHQTMADILRRPEAYSMPCLYPGPIEPDRVTTHGETWMWRGFRLTAFDLPGQTYFDAALLVERDSERVLFTGDSFTPGGLDDYCALNRNLLGPGVGYDRCLRLLDRLGPEVLLVNQHVPGAFVFSRAEVAHMRRTLDERRRLFIELLDWDDPNFGLDPCWVRLDPYFARVRTGARADWQVCIRNHSRRKRRFHVELLAPEGWQADAAEVGLEVTPRGDGRARLSAIVPEGVHGRAVVGLSVTMDGRRLGDIAEAMVEVL